MFFDLLSQPLKKRATVRELPPAPETGWRPCTTFPELSNATAIAFDCETKETDFEHGPGWARNAGHIVGVSIAALGRAGERGQWYFPVRHEVGREYNQDTRSVFGWLKRVLQDTPQTPKIGANLLYDCGWLATENIYPTGPLYDVQFAEALIDEEGLVALDHLGLKYLGKGKTDETCKRWCLQAYGGNVSEWRGNLWRTSPMLVGPYAEDDASLPLDIILRQWAVMEQEGTLDLFKMECRAIPMLTRMRMAGVRVDLSRAEEIRELVVKETIELYNKLQTMTGTKIGNVTEKGELKKIFDAAEVKYPLTAAGQPSFRKEWLALLDHPVGKIVNDIREREKLRDTFIDSYILDRAKLDGTSNSYGLLHCSFHPLRGDDGGAKTGRFSSSDPNLQNIPARTKLGQSIRSIFVPDAGHCAWHKKDYSQIEYRVFAHYASGSGADEIRAQYANDPNTDYHNVTSLLVSELRADKRHFLAMSPEERAKSDDWGRFRKPMKNVNFGLLYGQTEKSLAYKAGWQAEEAKAFFDSYHGRLPFVKTTMQAIQQEVQRYGYITTVLGRRTRFNRWEPVQYDLREKGSNYGYEHALRLFGSRIRRAYAYRAVNYRFQGSAADIFKAGMVACYESGVFETTGLPKLFVHDETDWSKIDNSPRMNEAFAYIAHTMENQVKLSVPLKVDSSEGTDWSKAK